VTVNGHVVRELGTRADPKRDRITVDGRPVRSAEQPVYLLLNKPTGVVTTLADPQGRPTIADLLRGVRQRVFPVGRLDFNTQGLLLLTNDGELALRLTHPRYGVFKTYHAKVRGRPDAEALQRLRAGVRLDEGTTGPAKVRVVEEAEKKVWLEISITEGKKHEVRRMCEAVGHPVEKLTRIALGPLKLGKLPPGKLRELTEAEVMKLQRLVGMGDEGRGARDEKRQGRGARGEGRERAGARGEMEVD
jgi:23S rRNA pseudouridine2605 synthase